MLGDHYACNCRLENKRHLKTNIYKSERFLNRISDLKFTIACIFLFLLFNCVQKKDVSK